MDSKREINIRQKSVKKGKQEGKSSFGRPKHPARAPLGFVRGKNHHNPKSRLWQRLLPLMSLVSSSHPPMSARVIRSLAGVDLFRCLPEIQTLFRRIPPAVCESSALFHFADSPNRGMHVMLNLIIISKLVSSEF